jgi:heat shock protein HslJ
MSTRGRRHASWFVAGAILLTACGTSSSAGGSPSGAASDLNGQTFVTTGDRSVVGGPTLVPGSQLRLSFTSNGFSASAGCNTMSGSGGVQDGSLVVNGALSQTEMACSPALMKQERWWADLLASTPNVEATDGALAMTSDAVHVNLVNESAAVADRPLDGTQWRLDGIIDGQSASSVPDGTTALVEFNRGNLDVQGCNSYSASYSVVGQTLTIGELSVSGTVHPCPTSGDALDRTLQTALHGNVTYVIDGDRLTLTNGPSALTFQAMLRM